MTNDSVTVHSDFAKRENIAFTLLADKQLKIIEAFGMTSPKYPKGTNWYGIATPGIFVIDPRGVVSHRFTGTDYRDRPSPEAVLSVLQKGASG